MCVVLTSLDGESTDSRPVDCLYSSQEEADTLIILHSLNADAEENENMDIIVRSPDTDVFLLLISVCQKFKHPLYFDTGVSNKRRMIHIQTLCDKMAKDIPEIILSFHAFTGSDSTSAFLQKGKVRPLTKLIKHPELVLGFSELGKHDIVPEHVLLKIEEFVCPMYGGKPNDRSVDKIRYDRARQKYRPNGKSLLSCVKGLDISLLPPCQQALRKHILRANYQALIWRKADIAYPDIPHPSGHGWNLSEDILSIDWCEVPVPQQLVDILYVSTTEEEGESTNNEADGMLMMMTMMMMTMMTMMTMMMMMKLCLIFVEWSVLYIFMSGLT